MNTLQTMIVNSTLTRLLANIFLFLLVIGCSFIAGYEIVMSQPLNLWVVAVLSTALGSSIKILGISTGVSFMNDTTGGSIDAKH